MQRLHRACRTALTLTLIAAAAGGAHATFPGENGVILYVTNGLMKAPADGKGPPTLIGGRLFHPAASPNGKRVAAVYMVTSTSYTLRVMNMDGSNAIDIDQLPYFMSFLAWSPDGKTLAATTGAGDVYLYDVATRAKRQIAAGLADDEPKRLSWSPLGDKLLLSARGTWVIDANTGQVESTLSWIGAPSWYPAYDASLVGVAWSPEEPYYCIRTGNLDGSNQVTLPICGQEQPSASPDGSKLLSATRLYHGASTVAIRDPKGQNVQVLADQAEPYTDWARVPMTAMRTVLTNNQWSPAAPLADDSDAYISQGAIAVMPDNGAIGGALRRAVGTGSDGRLYMRAQGVNGVWGAWTLVPGYAGHPPTEGIRVRQVSIAGAKNGSFQLAAVGLNGFVYHSMGHANGTWSGFGLLDWPPIAMRDTAIAIVNSSSTTPGQAHVVANDEARGAVYHRVRLDNGNWTPWGLIGQQDTGVLALAFAGNNDLYVLASTPTGIVRQVRNPGGNWDSWVGVSNVPDGGLRDVSLALVSSATSGTPVMAYLAFVGGDGQVAYQARYAPWLTSSWSDAPTRAGPVMANGRSVSMAATPGSAIGSGVELLSVQAQPQ